MLPLLKFYVLWLLFLLPMVLRVDNPAPEHYKPNPLATHPAWDSRVIVPLALQIRHKLNRAVESVADANCLQPILDDPAPAAQTLLFLFAAPLMPFPPADPCTGFMSLQL